MKNFKTYKEYSKYVLGRVCNTCIHWEEMKPKHSHDVVGECEIKNKFTYKIDVCDKYDKR